MVEQYALVESFRDTRRRIREDAALAGAALRVSGTSRARYCSTISSTVSSLRIMEISMRRFWAWPALVSLEATGRVSP